MVVKRFFCSFVAVVCIALIVVGCSTDNEPMVEDVIAPEVVDPIVDLGPKPDWDDGTITIEVGRFATKEEILDALKEKGYAVDSFIEEKATDPNFPLEQGEKRERHSVEVSVISMLEVGLNKPATLREIQNRFRERGYRPLTLEEALELRLQFHDQPPISSGHKMSAFYVLPLEGEGIIEGTVRNESVKILVVWSIFHYTREALRFGGNGPPYVIGIYYMSAVPGDTYRFGPHDPNPIPAEVTKQTLYRILWGEERIQGTRFACVKL